MKNIFLLFIVLQFIANSAVASALSIKGLWETKDKDAVVEFYNCDDDEICGRFYWLKDDSKNNPSLDDKNHDKEKRKRPLCGLKFLGGFKDLGKGDFGSGWIYSPRHGANFSAAIKLIDQNKLKLRGYFILPFLGESQVWTRKNDAIACH